MLKQWSNCDLIELIQFDYMFKTLWILILLTSEQGIWGSNLIKEQML